MRSLSRVTDVLINTVGKLLIDAGRLCAGVGDKYGAERHVAPRLGR